MSQNDRVKQKICYILVRVILQRVYHLTEAVQAVAGGW